MVINELFNVDNNENKFSSRIEEEVNSSFTVDGIEYEASFILDMDGDKDYHFYISDKGASNSIKVLSEILKIMAKFIKEYSPNSIMFSVNLEKSVFYEKLMNFVAHKFTEYTFNTENIGKRVRFIVKKN